MTAFLVPLVILGISIPLCFKMIPPNRVYGFRMEASFVSDQAWYAINRFGGVGLLLTSALVIVLMAALRQSPGFSGSGPGVWMPLLLYIVPVTATILYSRA